MLPDHRASRRAAILTVNYGSSDLLAVNLVQSRGDEIVVVTDNWSSPSERDKVLALARDYEWLVETPASNVGFGTGMNLAASRAVRAGATSLVLLNPDARIAPQELRRLLAQVEDDASLLLAPRILTSEGAPWMSTTMDLRLVDGTSRSSRHRVPGAAVMEWVSGAVMVLSVDLWQRIGGFDDDYFLYWEDVDLCRRAHQVGARIEVDQTVTAVHDEGGTHHDGGGRAKSETFYYFMIRNRALYAHKWLTPSDRRRWIRGTLRAGLDTVLTGGRRQFVQSVRPWRAYVRGVLAAYSISVRAARGRAPLPGRAPRR